MDLNKKCIKNIWLYNWTSWRDVFIICKSGKLNEPCRLKFEMSIVMQTQTDFIGPRLHFTQSRRLHTDLHQRTTGQPVPWWREDYRCRVSVTGDLFSIRLSCARVWDRREITAAPRLVDNATPSYTLLSFLLGNRVATMRTMAEAGRREPCAA